MKSNDASLPEPIETEREGWEGYRRDKFQEELVEELVDKYNQLIAYLKAQQYGTTPD